MGLGFLNVFLSKNHPPGRVLRQNCWFLWNDASGYARKGVLLVKNLHK